MVTLYPSKPLHASIASRTHFCRCITGCSEWIETPENGLPPGYFNQWLNLSRYPGEPVIMAFDGGSSALALAGLSDEEIVERAVRTLNGAYPA